MLIKKLCDACMIYSALIIVHHVKSKIVNGYWILEIEIILASSPQSPQSL